MILETVHRLKVTDTHFLSPSSPLHSFCQDLLPLEVSGATGPHADKFNGTYMYTEERLNGKTMNSKRGDSRCLFFATDKRWYTAEKDEKVKAGKPAGFASTEECLSHPMLAKQWRVWDGKAWQPQPLKASVMMSS